MAEHEEERFEAMDGLMRRLGNIQRNAVECLRPEKSDESIRILMQLSLEEVRGIEADIEHCLTKGLAS